MARRGGPNSTNHDGPAFPLNCSPLSHILHGRHTHTHKCSILLGVRRRSLFIIIFTFLGNSLTRQQTDSLCHRQLTKPATPQKEKKKKKRKANLNILLLLYIIKGTSSLSSSACEAFRPGYSFGHFFVNLCTAQIFATLRSKNQKKKKMDRRRNRLRSQRRRLLIGRRKRSPAK